MKKFLLIAALLTSIAWIDPFSDEVQRGNSSLRENNPKKALEHYKEAENHAPDEKSKSLLEYNRGDAHYGLQNYDIAIDKFKGSVSSGDPEIQKRAFFNTGNSYMKQKKYKEAAESYIKALEIDPNYEKAKRNLEYILKERKNDDKKNSDSNKDSGDDKSGKDQKKNDPGDSEKKMNDIQARNILESMKNKPVRKQKGKGDGKRYLEKYW